MPRIPFTAARWRQKSAQPVVGDQNGNRHDDDRAGRTLADPLGAAAGRQAEMAPDDGDDKSENRGLGQSGEEIAEQHGLEGRLHEEARPDVVLDRGDEHRPEGAERVREDAQKWHYDHRGHHARQDELFRRIPSERADGIHLFGHVHCADLRRHTASDPPPDDDRRQRRPEFSQEGKNDDARDVFDAAESLETEGELDGHDHPDEHGGDGDDTERAHPQRFDLVNRGRDFEGTAQQRYGDSPGENANAAHVVDETRGSLHEPMARGDGRERRRQAGAGEGLRRFRAPLESRVAPRTRRGITADHLRRRKGPQAAREAFEVEAPRAKKAGGET